MNYKNVSTAIWTDDTVLGMSPEQKLVYLYLHTSPFTSVCGIFKMHPKTMGFQIGLVHTPFENALRGLCGAFPDLVAADWETQEVALLQYPRQLLITASARAMSYVEKEIMNIQSQYLLREMIRLNSAGLSKSYLAHLRRLQMNSINRQEDTLLQPPVTAIEEPEPTAPQKPASSVKSHPSQDDITAVQADLKSPNKAAEFLCRCIRDMGDETFPHKHATDYFLHKAQNGVWVSLVLPQSTGWKHRWIGEHSAGVRRWAKNQQYFQPGAASSSAPVVAQVAPTGRKNPHL